jgi:DNA recombination protein RmuC
MTEALSWLTPLLLLGNVLLLVLFLLRQPHGQKLNELREELRVGREEAARAARESREELSNNLRNAYDTLSNTFNKLRDDLHTCIQDLHVSHEQQMDQVRRTLDEKMAANKDSNEASLDRIRASIDTQAKELLQSNETKLGEIRKTLDEKLAESRQELSDGLTSASEKLSLNLNDIWQAQRIQLEGMSIQLKDFSESNQKSLDLIRVTLDLRVKELQDSNEKKLDDMRKTVDEKLHETLENRLGASFAMVSERLEAVHRGLGEMQNLATGVGDLQRVLTNVKVRGTWAEVQLGGLLDEILAPGQYERNVRVKADSSESVEYAVRLPGKGEDPSTCLWLPIDSKFPQEDYRRLQDAADRADLEATRKATEDLLRTIRTAAQQIHTKYINPPNTTDFAIMFLATEGLYGEVLRQPSLVEELQRRYRVVVAGPTTLIAILNSLRIGFQTLAIEQRASEIATVLGAVKTEFGKFGEILVKVKGQLNRTARTIEQTEVRTRAIERRLRSVEQLPEMEAIAVLQISVGESTGEVDELEGIEVVASDNTE